MTILVLKALLKNRKNNILIFIPPLVFNGGFTANLHPTLVSLFWIQRERILLRVIRSVVDVEGSGKEFAMFKADWEKTSVTHQLQEGIVEKMVGVACPEEKLISYKLIAGGCVNLNIKIFFENKKNPLILRVYLRDKDAAYREQKLAVLLKQNISVPLTHCISEFEGYRFSLTEFMPGILLRDLLLSDVSYDLNAIMYEVGAILFKITAYKFSKTGFFDKELNVITHLPPDNYLIFAETCLKNETVISVLTPAMIFKIKKVLDQYGHLFPDEREKHLVHADFDPANILVNKVGDIWKVSGVLDWEFAFSGSMLHDVANMIRYAHKISHEFQEAFLKGLRSDGLILPKNWHITCALLNLISLLDCLKRSDPKKQPHRCLDICELIEYILSDFFCKYISRCSSGNFSIA